MDALNHADQMRLANLINDNSDDAEIQKKLDQVVELTSSTRDQAAVALHDCHYDVEKAVDMILEGDQAIVENQWKSAGKKKNKNNTSQATKSGPQSGGYAGGSNKNSGPSAGKGHHHAVPAAPHGSHQSATSNARSTGADGAYNKDYHYQRGNHQSSAAPQQNSSNNSNIINTQNSKHDAPDSLKNIAGISSSNLINSSDLATTPSSTTTAAVTTTKAPLMQQHQPQHQQPQHLQHNKHQQPRQKGTMQIGNRQHQQRSTRIPDSAVEMPNNELQMSSLNIQFGELDLKEGSVSASDSKGTFQDVLESNRLSRQTGLPSSHHSQQDMKGNRQASQQYVGRGGPRRPYNNSGDDRKFYGNSNRGRQISGGQRQYNQRSGPLNQSGPRGGGVRTILNRGLQPNSNLSNSSSNQQSSGFPNSIDTWTNSTAEAASKPSQEQNIANVGNTLRVGQWSDVAGNEDWSEEEHWDAKVMETKVFTPSSKSVEGPVTGQKNQLLTDTSVPSQMNLTSKLVESARDDVTSQTNVLNSVTQPVQSQQSSQKQLSHMNDIFDPSVAKAVLEQQSLAAIKPKTSIGIGQYNKETSESKNVLDPQNLGSIKPKTTMSMNQYNKEASESLKSLVGISTAGANSSSNNNNKSGVPSVPPGALPMMSQPQYIMGNAYHQPAIFPYAYQAPDVHYPVAAPTTGRDQNFQSVYSPNDGNKFNRGTDGDAPSITTTQTAPVASQTHSQAFVTNALHGYQLTYAMPQAFNMMPQNLYSAAPIFPHIPQPTNTGSANTVYQKNTPASYQHHTGYSGYDPLNPLIQDYVNKQQNYSGSSMQQQQQQQQPISKSSGVGNELDVTSGGNSYNMYGSVSKGQTQPSKQAGYNDTKGYQQQMSNNGPQHQFGFSHNTQQPSSLAAGYPLLQPHNLDNIDLSGQSGNAQSQLHSAGQRGSQVNPSKYPYNWN